ncbi:hypothetical protein BUZ83_08820 [Staphylococcus saprophyticus]|uniref:Bacteriocin n=1 Tax=Staphylococcus gallinarum TaxID=1293 RepID=A0A3A0VHI7_STAGA|nr:MULTISPECIES: hypothetical protein [Staphylococcus]RIO22000.1 hypothetical protein BUZ83_08820 [Staphylococcus saprophyticus]RIP31870.1 hypothetical protein BUZ14_13340 [Staphylococcus gallinarum]
MKKLNANNYVDIDGGKKCTSANYTSVAFDVAKGAGSGAAAMSPTGLGALGGGLVGGTIGLAQGAANNSCTI